MELSPKMIQDLENLWPQIRRQKLPPGEALILDPGRQTVHRIVIAEASQPATEAGTLRSVASFIQSLLA